MLRNNDVARTMTGGRPREATTLSTDFGLPLRQRTQDAGLSGAELARRLSKNKSTVSRWFNGEDRPEPNTVVQIADVLGIDRLELLREVGYLPAEGDLAGARQLPTLNPRLASLLARIEAGWLAMETEAERAIAERGTLALFGSGPTQHAAKTRAHGSANSTGATAGAVPTGADLGEPRTVRRRQLPVTRM
jgi:transcriptional regulator with XRE-family HTH domain